MNKLTILFVASAIMLAATPFVLADETKADCESGQKWIGYSDTDAIKDAYNSVADGTPGQLNTCEGEQWDGQDQVSSAPAGSNTGATECVPQASAGSTINVNECMSNDLNADTTNNAPTATPLGVRVSVDPSGQVYVGTNIRLVGDAAVYAGHTDKTRGAVYLRDNSNDAVGTNVLATVVSAARLTKGFVAEGDCTQAQYAQSAQDPNHPTCGRDNTAITLELLA